MSSDEYYLVHKHLLDFDHISKKKSAKVLREQHKNDRLTGPILMKIRFSGLGSTHSYLVSTYEPKGLKINEK